jgi:hypothetical protein
MRAPHEPLRAARPARQMHEHFPLAFSEYDRLRSWSRHLLGGSLRVVPGDFTAVGSSINGWKLPLQCSRVLV